MQVPNCLSNEKNKYKKNYFKMLSMYKECSNNACKHNVLNFNCSFLWTKHTTNCSKVSFKNDKAYWASKWKKWAFILVLFICIIFFRELLLTMNYTTWRNPSAEITATTELNIDDIKGQLFSYKSFLRWRSKHGTKLPWRWLAGYTTKYEKNVPLCLRNNSQLGPTTVNKTLISLEWAANHTAGVKMGGMYAPTHCRTRHKVAILIPYRDREHNLPILLYHLHKLLKKQYLDYAVFVIEQAEKDKFNKGSLYNTGFMVTQLLANWTCLIFHDVDLVPLDERILYTCPRRPTHMSTLVEGWGFRMAYRFLFGGVTAMKPEVYESVNGYSNYYWDWGAEDDDMLRRLMYTHQSIYRISQDVGRFASLPHKRNRINPKKYASFIHCFQMFRFMNLMMCTWWFVLTESKRRYRFEGLQSTMISVMNVTKRPLFTHVLVDINPFNDTLPYSV